MYKTIGLFAHVDSGKTTFAEQILYLTKSIRERGRVDHQTSFLDYHEVERDRGITVFSEQALFTYEGSQIHLIDTPGHVDFSTEMERAMSVMDYAVILISAVEGIQGHTTNIWHLLKSKNIPVFFFINKTDREGADVSHVIEQIRSRLGIQTLYIERASVIKEMPETFVEDFAMCDEQLMSEFFEQRYTSEDWKRSLIQLIHQQKIAPIMSGSALKNKGVEDFLFVINQLTSTQYNIQDDFSGFIYKVRYDAKGEKLAFIKATSGQLKVRATLLTNNQTAKEKINQIRLYNGNQYRSVDQICAGQLFAVTGLQEARIGDTFGDCCIKRGMKLMPTVQVAVFYPSTLSPTEILTVFRKLEAEDPTLSVEWNTASKQLYIHIMGIIQLDILKEMVKNRFNIDIDFGPREVIYLETIENSVIGRGHYEPLKHYAEVHLKMEPAPRGSGILFESVCHTDQLSLSYQNLVKDYVQRKDLKGILTGSFVTDLKVTLITGAAHDKHTSGGDFKEATYRALRQGLEKSSNLLLEPYYQVEIQADLNLMGRLLTDLQKANGEYSAPLIDENRCLIYGKAPVATFMNYPIEFMSLTKGQGQINLVVSGYERCHNQADIVALSKYNKQADREFPSSSIFCSKGSGFSVPWEEADSYMHCQS